MLEFEREYTTVRDASPFEDLHRVLALEGGAEKYSPWEGGSVLFGYLYYEVAHNLECLPILAEDDLRLPTARFILPRYALGVGRKGVWALVRRSHPSSS